MTSRIASALMITLGALGWQTAPQPARGAIAGVVLSTNEPAQPVRRAIVSVSGGALPSNLSAVTDDDGRFRFVGLPAGRYTVAVAKAGYLSTMYGASKAGRPGTAIALADDQQLDIRLRLAKGAVITGIVRDALAQPLVGADVTIALAETATGASSTSFTARPTVTDDRGEYRIYSLAAGEYLVYALPRSVSSGELIQMTRSDYDAKARALEQRMAAPANAKPVPASSRPIQTTAFAPVFYPGTPVVADAVPVKIGAGEERGGVDITFAPVPAAHVSGVIQGPGVPISRLIPSLTPIGPSLPVLSRPSVDGPREDGSFTYRNVTPGRYVLMVRSGQGAMMRTADRRGGTGNNPDIPSMFAMQEIVVSGADIDGVALSLRPAVAIRGTIVFDAHTRKPPDTPVGIGVLLNAVGPSLTTTSEILGLSLGMDRPPSTNASATGAFELIGVLPGTYTLTAAPPAGWWLRSANVNGRDLLDDLVQIDVASTDIADVVLSFSDRTSGIVGTLSAASGQPAPEFTVIAFPVDRNSWKAGARRIKTTRPSSDGSFVLPMLPPGEYFLAALTDLEPGDSNRPSFLEQLVAAAAKINVAEGQQTRQDLRIAR